MKTKKRKKHKKSILQEKDGTCYLCARLYGDYRPQSVQEHHVFDGNPNRRHSEAEGFKVYLCLFHHTIGPEAVHNNRRNMRLIQEDAQRAYERSHSREQFMALIGRNYLDEEESHVSGADENAGTGENIQDGFAVY